MTNFRSVLGELLRVLRPVGAFVFAAPSRLFGEYLLSTGPFREIRIQGGGGVAIGVPNEQRVHWHCSDQGSWSENPDTAGLRVLRQKYCLCRKTVSAWDISQPADLGYGRVKLGDLVKRLAALLERTDERSLRRLSAKLLTGCLRDSIWLRALAPPVVLGGWA
jgi:hypothetical protein